MDRVIVRFKADATEKTMAATHASVGAQVITSYKMLPGLQVVRLPDGLRVYQAIKLYRQNPAVAYAEPDYTVHATATPNDPYYEYLWGMDNILAPQAWNLTTGNPNLVVGVIDTGVDYTHPDLVNNIYSNAAECSGTPGVDDDGFGYVDDCHGMNFAYNPAGTGDPMDDNGHGTHVSGTIAGVGNNGIGVVGVNWQAKVLACKFLGSNGSGYTDAAISCVDYFIAMAEHGVPVVAINNSWGGIGYSQALHDAIAALIPHDILFTAAAGNDGRNTDLGHFYPADYFLPNVISVAAIQSDGTYAAFSNYGKQSVHVAAPGVDILSTLPGGYGYGSGTSMATPHVTGVAALLKAQNPSLDFYEIRNLIMAGGTPMSATGKTVTDRTLNAFGAMTCDNSIVQARLQPVGDVVTVTVDTPINLTMLNINCDSPNGSVGNVTINPGALSVPLVDDGTGGDQWAADGVFSATWTPTEWGVYTFSFPNGEQIPVQVVTPYAFSSPSFSYRTLTSATNLNTGDETATKISSPFPVRFGGGAFTDLWVGDNGTISVVGPFISYWGWYLPSEWVESITAPWWDDFVPVPATNNNVFWQVTGTAPNRELVVEWRDVPHYYYPQPNLGETVKFQTVFFEGKPDILFNYADASFGGATAACDYGACATIGVQSSALSGTTYSFRSPDLDASMALLWTTDNPPPLVTALATNQISGGTTFTLHADGLFLKNAVMRWNGQNQTTTFNSSTDVSASIAGSALTTPGTFNVTVFHPTPGGGESAAFPVLVTGYDLAVPSDSKTVTAGQKADYDIQVTPSLGSFDNPVVFSCSLPTGKAMSCIVSPGSVTPGQNATTTKLTVSTTARSNAALAPMPGWRQTLPLYAVWLPLAGIALAVAGRPRTRLLGLLALAVLLLILLPACGGGSSTPPPPPQQGTPPGTYTVSVTATSGSLTHTASVTLVVQ